MTNLTKFFAAMMLAFGLLSTAHASSTELSTDQFATHQSEEAPATGEDGEEKKKDGEEEEPDC